MAIEPELTRGILREEIKAMRDYGKSLKWGVVPDFARLTVIATLYAHDNEQFIVQFQCDNYKELPPIVDFIDPDSGEVGTKHAYPKGHDSFFHAQGPCICAPFNRKAYASIHTNWTIGNWMSSKENNTDWSSCSTLVGMLAVIQARLDRKETYSGRMA